MPLVQNLLISALLVVLVLNGILSFFMPMWATQESPLTQQCYEIRTSVNAFGWSRSISPIDSKFCEAKK